MHVSPLLPALLVAQLGADPALPAAPCLACRSDREAIRRTYAGAEWEALQRGEVITTQVADARSHAGVTSTMEASAIVPYPPEPVWSVVVDFESRPRFVPGNKAARILRRDGNRVWVAQHLRVMLVNVRFVVISTLDPEAGAVTWMLDRSAPHDIADTTGSWTIVPLAGRRQTLVRYRTTIDSGRAVPGFIEDYLVKRSLPRIVDGLRDEVQRRFPLLRAAPTAERAGE